MAARLRAFFKQETVLCISALCAAATMLAVPPDGAYPGYIDLRVLCLLACLMAVVAGVRRCGAFEFLAAALLRRSSGGRILGVILVLLPFFTSMLVTNDVALLTFVPFTLLLLDQIGCRDRAAMILVLQTMAANLGSMATPVGNPQNLYLYGAYNLTAGSFFAVMLPLTAISLVGLTAAAVPVLPRTLPVPDLEEAPIRSPKKLGIYLLLFALCLLTVFRDSALRHHDRSGAGRHRRCGVLHFERTGLRAAGYLRMLFHRLRQPGADRCRPHRFTVSSGTQQLPDRSAHQPRSSAMSRRRCCSPASRTTGSPCWKA